MSFAASTDKSSKGARSVFDPFHFYAAQSWTTTSWNLISIIANEEGENVVNNLNGIAEDSLFQDREVGLQSFLCIYEFHGVLLHQ